MDERLFFVDRKVVVECMMKVEDGLIFLISP